MKANQPTVSTPVNVEEIFAALETWIKQRPRLQYANYGNPTSYRAELRDIGKDKTRALKALDEARGMTPARPELLIDAFSAFSGRLEWCPAVPVCEWCPTGSPAHLEYTTGQYWPTEYRKAAASVLERYIASWRQKAAAENPPTFTYRSMADVESANRQIGNHWFDRDTMRFFNTKIESGLIGGKYFITSERYDEDRPRRYSVRRADTDGTIDTVGEFHAHLTREDAREVIREAMKGEK
jgi:hypothetical protein